MPTPASFHRRRPTPSAEAFTVGRFTCRWSPNGRKLTVDDPVSHTSVEAKPREWVELGEAIAAALAARELRGKRG